MPPSLRLALSLSLALTSLARAQGEHRAELNLHLVGPGDEPYARVTRLHLFDETGADREAVTDDRGRVALTRVLMGRYVVWLDPAEGGPGQLICGLEVTPGADTQTESLKVREHGAVKGRLLLPDGGPAAGYTVSTQSSLWPTGEMSPAERRLLYARGAVRCYNETVADAEGRFELNGLTCEPQLLDVRAPGQPRPLTSLDTPTLRPVVPVDLGLVVLKQPWQWLYDGGAELVGWKPTNFGGEGPVTVADGVITLEFGGDLTGITWTGEHPTITLPRLNYELLVTGRRIEGHDFWCGLTFPVKDDPLTYICGGWGGGLVGLSSLDGADASENETSQWYEFDQFRWYRARVRVTEGRVECWLDNRRMIDVDVSERKLGVRWEVEKSVPLGIATWRTTAELRDLRLRRLD